MPAPPGPAVTLIRTVSGLNPFGPVFGGAGRKAAPALVALAQAQIVRGTRRRRCAAAGDPVDVGELLGDVVLIERGFHLVKT